MIRNRSNVTKKYHMIGVFSPGIVRLDRRGNLGQLCGESGS